MNSAQEDEFNVFGIVSKRLRAGLMIGLLSLSIAANVYQATKMLTIQGELYEKMLSRVDSKVDEKLKEPIKDIKNVVGKVDTAADKAIGAADRVDSVANQYNKDHKK